MGLTTDPEEARSSGVDPVTGMQNKYVVLSEEERAKGFVEPVRTTYTHVGARPSGPTRPLTEEEEERFGKGVYKLFEPDPSSETGRRGRLWTESQLNSGCGSDTTMSLPLAETYARDPGYYGGTYCASCRAHFPVGPFGEFVWAGTNQRVGTVSNG